MASGDRANEARTAPELLRGLGLRGKVVTADALQTQRDLSAPILAAGGDDLWLAKDNQPRLRPDIAPLFTADNGGVEGRRLPDGFRAFRTVERGHGRREFRGITVSGELKG